MNAEYKYWFHVLMKQLENVVDQDISAIGEGKRMKITLVLAIVAVLANISFRWYEKKCNKTKSDESSNLKNGSFAFPKGYLNTPEVKQLRKSTAAELDLSIAELDRMLYKEFKQMAKEKGLIHME